MQISMQLRSGARAVRGGFVDAGYLARKQICYGGPEKPDASALDFWRIDNVLWSVSSRGHGGTSGGRPATNERRSTEPNTGLETLKLRTKAVRRGDKYMVTGEKMFGSRVRTAFRRHQTHTPSQMDHECPDR